MYWSRNKTRLHLSRLVSRIIGTINLLNVMKRDRRKIYFIKPPVQTLKSRELEKLKILQPTLCAKKVLTVRIRLTRKSIRVHALRQTFGLLHVVTFSIVAWMHIESLAKHVRNDTSPRFIYALPDRRWNSALIQYRWFVWSKA